MERVGVGRVVAVLCRVRRGSSVVVRWFMTSMVSVVWLGGVSREVEVRLQAGGGNRVFVFRGVGSEALWL